MTVQSHTYNFNYPNMNLGQAIGYGILGSLTGGCGMGGSIFSMMGMGGFGCGSFGGFGGYGLGGLGMGSFGMGGFGMGCYSNQMLGLQIGTSLYNIGLGVLGQYLEGRGGKIAEREEESQQIEEAKEILNITEIQDVSGMIFPSSEDSKVENAIKDAINQLGTVPSTRPSENSDISEKKDTDNKITGYEYNNKTYATKDLAIAAVKEDQNKYDTKEALNNLLTTYKNENVDLSSNLIPNNVKNAVKTRNEAEADFNYAKEIIQAAFKKQQEERVNFNNKNAKLEAKCDALGDVDDTKGIEEQKTAQGKFNKAYELFKNNQNQDNFNKLKTAYNNIEGNKNSFTKLMKHIIKQHPDFDQTNIQWA